MAHAFRAFTDSKSVSTCARGIARLNDRIKTDIYDNDGNTITTRSRLAHALSNAFLTHGDNGKRQINYSAFGGEMVSGAIANAVYPSRDRGAKLMLDSFLVGTAARMGMGVFQEFVLHKFTSKPSSQLSSDPIITQ